LLFFSTARLLRATPVVLAAREGGGSHMKCRIVIIAAVALLPLAVAASAQEGGRPFTIQMTGAAEVPGPGDPDGSGIATFRINPGQGRICYTLTVQDIEPAAAAHIHRVPPDPGPIVVHLAAPTDGSSEGCATVDRALAQEIIQNPESFYVNVHNTPYPRGAVRGNFSR
jgi:hypothetical protein